jgi:ElaB/YqjD/DUF883 family membrane-anchored ribosome-binding protein
MSSQQENPSSYSAEGADYTVQTETTETTGGSRSRRVKGQISEFAQSAKNQASAAMQPIANNARSMADEQKARGAERIGNIAQAIHSAADEIAKEVPLAANYVHSAADKLDNASRTLRENSVDDLLRMTTEFAEERPYVFLGGAVAAGFMLMRLLRSSPVGDEESGEE